MKKSFLRICFIIMLFVFFATPVFAANITDCNSALGDGVMIDEKIPNLVHLIITVIKIAVPVLLVIFGMIDMVKGITAQKEDEIKKGQQIFIKRLITGVLIFFIVTAVQFLISLVGDDDKENIMNCANCFINGDCSTTKKVTEP